MLKSQEAQVLQQQRDQLLGLLCQRGQAILNLAEEKQSLQRHLLQFAELMMKVHLKDFKQNQVLESFREDLQKTQVMEPLRQGPCLGGPGCLQCLTLHSYLQEVLAAARLLQQQAARPRGGITGPREGEWGRWCCTG